MQSLLTWRICNAVRVDLTFVSASGLLMRGQHSPAVNYDSFVYDFVIFFQVVFQVSFPFRKLQELKTEFGLIA